MVGGFLIDQTGNWQLPFVGSMVLMLVGMALTFRMRPDQRLDVALSRLHCGNNACNRMFFASGRHPVAN